MKELKLEAAVAHLDKVLAFIDEELGAAGCPMKTQMQIDVVVEEVFVNVIAVTVLGMMVMIGIALMMRFPVWWGYLISCVIGGFGVFGLLAGLAELVKFLAGVQKTP